VRPGQEAFLATGKEGAPDRQRSRIRFPVTVRAVDQYWNLADTTNVGAIHFSATDNSINEGNPAAMDLPFVNGRRSFDIWLDAEGMVDLSVFDADDSGRPGQTVSIPVDPGYEYQVTVPDTTPQTGFPGFQMIVEMIDPVTGEPAPGANHSFTVTALNPDLSVADGNLAVTEGTLAAGVRVINNQQYDRVESIVLRVSDAVGRVGYSGVIAMQPGGLGYLVAVPDTATVGGPATFPVTVTLLDLGTGLVVASCDTTFSVTVYSAQTGQVGAGSWSVGSAVLVDGTCAFDQSYTGAGRIYLRVSDGRGVVGTSPTCVLLPDGYKRLQIIAPGETPAPGASSATGKTGAPIMQQAEVPFMLQVRATDQYWNLLDDFDAGAIRLASSDGSLGDGNPVNQGAPLIGGIGDYAVVLHDQGSVTITAEDEDDSAILAHAVDIPVGQASYQILVPATAQAGPPAVFPITVRLVRPDSSLITMANHEVFLQALRPNHEGAHDTLGVRTGVLAAGELHIPHQTYATVEDIVIRVSDDLGRQSYSPVIHMVPEDVTYLVETPTTAVVGPPATFTVSLRLVDTATGQLVTSDDRSFGLVALNHNTGEPGTGSLSLTSGSTTGGLCTLELSYSAAEAIYLRITDDRGVSVFSDPVQVAPGPPNNLQVTSSHDELEVGHTANVTATVRDLFGNLVVNRVVTFALLAGDGVLGADSVLTGSLGTATTTVSVPAGGRADIRLRVGVAGLPDRTIDIGVIGPPLTVISLDGTAVEAHGAVVVTPETVFQLQSSSEIGLHQVYYGVDLGAEDLPQAVYSAPLTFADLGIAATGRHTLSFFAEDIHGNRENVQTLEILLGAELAADKSISNRPNPFRAGREETLILFRARASGVAEVELYDLFGHLVWNRSLDVSAGAVHQVPWDGRNGRGEVVGNGGYVCVVRTGGEILKRKIAVLK
ncbi:MAG: hypothetical protein JW819_11705, partial [Candidatus Krumholzibacteriota bacterium]|nr:hypothetical protein [Candidatus Krumholzibacteriota bacterium]